MPRISIIVPTLMESTTIAACLEPLQPCRGPDLEVIVVDGRSHDDTVARADRLADRVLSVDPGRASQMNAGWREACGELVVFLHADTRMDANHVNALQALPELSWGRFDVRLSGRKWAFRMIEFAMNVRSRMTGMATGDQAIFASRVLLERCGGFPDLPLMEDLALCQRLKAIQAPDFPAPPVITSSRRWEQHGTWRTIFLMWRLRYAWWRGVDPNRLAQRYRTSR